MSRKVRSDLTSGHAEKHRRMSARIFAVGDFTRPEFAQDTNNFIDWVWQARAINLFDPDVMTYPQTAVMAVDSMLGAPLLYMPLQSAFVMESLAPRPGLTPRQEALALAKLHYKVEEVALETGHREIYFVCHDERVIEFAKAHGYEEVKYTVLKRKLQPK